ncbi:MAG: methyl-accepting chemotaxis protein [Nitrospirae bacterium]|nr:MAG: methyl-accepting chemotaxis protein [Nitrospirota bacterium]
MFKNMGLRKKLVAGFLVTIIMLGAAVIIQIYQMGRLGNIQDKGAEMADEAVLATSAADVGVSFYQTIADAVINRNLSENAKEWAERKEQNLKKIDDVMKLQLSPEQRRLAEDSKKAAVNIITQFEKEMLPLLASSPGVTQGVREIDGKIDSDVKTVRENMTRISDLFGQKMKEGDSYFDSVRKTAMMIAIIIAVLAIVVSIFIAYLVSLDILKQVGGEPSYVADIAEKISNGDLSLKFTSGASSDTGIFASVKKMSERLKVMVSDIKTSSDTIASSSEQLSSSSEQMSRGVTEQSARASQIATSTTEMSQTVVDIAKNASEIAAASGNTARIASSGREIVSRSVDEVNAIANTVGETAKLIESLGERSKQIGEIINVIKDIADQTNLLALNAAIEAARAGEQGRGFAVVADEVRKLAERTAKATSEIGGMIGAIQKEVGQAVESMNEATEKVTLGAEDVTKAGDSLNSIVESVNTLQTMVQQIASATEEMSTVSETISSDIETVARVSKETSASSGQIAQASSDLARLSSNMQRIVGQFRV